MRRLLPLPASDVDPAEVYALVRSPVPDRPWVVANMVTSTDGAATVDGRSGGLGGAADRQVFRLLRAQADVVVAAAGTVRTERYRPITAPRPIPVAVVSRSLELDWSSPLFTEAAARTIVLTCEAADPDRRADAARRAEVVVAGDDAVDLRRALGALHDRGCAVALCEGGPSLLAQLVDASLLDELCLTLSPLLVGGDGPRLLTAGPLSPAVDLTLTSVLEDDGALLLRYLVDRSGSGPGTS